MRFWVDIENSSGTRQGEGPVATAQYFEVTSRISKAGSVKMSMPGVDPRSALIIKKNIMRGKTMIGTTTSEIGAGTIDHIERTQNSDRGIVVDVTGDDLLRELVNRHVGELLIDDGAGGPDDDGPTVVLALAPSGWTLDSTEGYENSYKSVYHQYDGETVLEAMINLSKLTGEHFRLGTGRKVIWMRKLGSAKVIHKGITGTFTMGERVSGGTSLAEGIIREATGGASDGYLYIEDVTASFLDGETITGDDSGATTEVDSIYNPSSGVLARQGINPVDMEDNSEVCLITSLKEIEDSYETQIGRVYAIGSGNGDAKLTLQGATVTPPTGYALSNDSKGYYLEHTSTWNSYGIERRKSFKDAQDPDELYEQAYEYLSRAKDTNKAYAMEVTKLDQALPVGKTINVVYQRWIGDVFTGTRYNALNIDTDLYILEATNRIEASGLRSAMLVVATVDELPSPENDANAMRDFIQQNQQIATHRQPVDGPSVGAHASTHQNSGSDEINVGGLSGELADAQTPKSHNHSIINVGSSVELTIASGAVTRTQTYHTLDTEGDAGTDDLDTINGGANGDILILRPVSPDRTIVAKDGTGNLSLAGDFTMDDNDDTLVVILAGSLWLEISRSDNAA